MPGFFGALAAVGPSGVQIVSSASMTDASNATTYNFTVPITGDWDGLIISVGTRASSNRTVSSLTAATNAWTQATHMENSTRCGALGAIKLSGSGSVDISVTWSGSTNNCGVAVLAVKNLTSATAFDTAATTTGDPTFAMLVDVQAGGIVVGNSLEAQGSIGASSADCGWTGATRYHNDLLDDSTTDFAFSSAYNLASSASTDYAITAAWTNAGAALGFGLAASFL